MVCASGCSLISSLAAYHPLTPANLLSEQPKNVRWIIVFLSEFPSPAELLYSRHSPTTLRNWCSPERNAAHLRRMINNLYKMGDKYLHFTHLLLHARARALEGSRTWTMPSDAAQTHTHTLESKPLYEYEIYRKEKSIQMHVRHVVKVLKYSKVNVVGSSFAYTYTEGTLTYSKEMWKENAATFPW